MNFWKKVKDALSLLKDVANVTYKTIWILSFLVLIGGAIMPPIRDFFRSFIVDNWYWFYFFSILLSFFLILTIQLIRRQNKKEKQKLEYQQKESLKELLEEKEKIKDRIFIIPRPEIFYYEIYLYVINASKFFDIKVSNIEAIMNDINFKGTFLNVDEKIIGKLSSKQIQLKPEMVRPKSIVLNPTQVVEKKINGTMFFSIEGEELSIPIYSNLIWRNVNATT